MKAFLLTAGLGTRLKPITNTTPKCLVHIKNKPILYWWVELFKKYGIDTVLVNTHHLPKQINNFIYNSNDKIYWDVRYERTLLGSAGTLSLNKSFIRGEKDFFIFYSDVLTNINLRDFLKFHRTNNSKFTMAVSVVDNTDGKGVVELNGSIIKSFEEKPPTPRSNYANMGIYICTPPVLDLIPDKKPADIGGDLLPILVGDMCAYKSNEYFCDIGTPESLKRANNEFKGL